MKKRTHLLRDSNIETVLIHTGVNDLKTSDAEPTSAEITSTVKSNRRARPDIHIVISKVATMKSAELQKKSELLNCILYMELHGDKKISFVGHDTLRPVIHLQDNIHPNAKGAGIIAANIGRHLQKQLWSTPYKKQRPYKRMHPHSQIYDGVKNQEGRGKGAFQGNNNNGRQERGRGFHESNYRHTDDSRYIRGNNQFQQNHQGHNRDLHYYAADQKYQGHRNQGHHAPVNKYQGHRSQGSHVSTFGYEGHRDQYHEDPDYDGYFGQERNVGYKRRRYWKY